MASQTYEIYDWITDELLVKILKSHENDKNVKLIKRDVNHATLKGDNYVGALFRAKLSYSVDDDSDVVKDVSFILKSSLEDELMSEISETYSTFQRETAVYKNIAKDGEKLLKSIGDDTIFAPNSVYCDEKVIVLEDLSVRGYKTGDRKERLDLNHLKATLTKVAKFHAVTAVLMTQNPDLFNFHMNGTIDENETPLYAFFMNTIASCNKIVKTFPELEKYYKKLENFEETIIPRLTQVFKRNDKKFNVLNHGDLWTNNIMFQEDENNQVKDVLLVDYQEGFYGSPGIDLNFLFYSSARDDVLENSVDELIALYHKILSETLEKLKFVNEIPTLEQIKDEFLSKKDHGVVSGLCILPILIIEQTEYAEPMHFILDDEENIKARNIVFSNPKYGSLLKTFLPYFEKRGMLD